MASKERESNVYSPLPQSESNDTDEEIFGYDHNDEQNPNACTDEDCSLTSSPKQKVLKRGVYPVSLKKLASNIDSESGGLKSKYRIFQGRKKNKLFKKSSFKNRSFLSLPCVLNKSQVISLCIALIFCVVCVIVIWVLPCGTKECVETPVKFLHSQEWQRNVPGIAISTPLHVFPDLTNPTFNILFGFKSLNVNPDGGGQLRFSESSLASGLLASSGLDGSSVWRQPVSTVPHDITCDLLDVTGDLTPECIIVGKTGQLGAHKVYTGEKVWAQPLGSSYGSIPVLVPDLDNDGTPDLLTTTRSEGNEAKLLIISGQKGSVLGSPVEVQGCDEIQNIKVDLFKRGDHAYVSFVCEGLHEEHSVSLLLHEIYSSSLNGSSITFTPVQAPSHFHLRPVAPLHNMLIRNRDSILNISNSGSCPYSCRRQVTLLNKKGHQIWRSDSEFAVAFSPVAFNCSRFGKNCAGFVFKLWEWISAEDDLYEELKTPESVHQLSKRSYSASSQVSSSKIQIVSPSEEVINVVMEEDTQQSPAHYTGMLHATPENRNMHAMRITESLMAVVTDGLTVYSSTLSRLRVVQLCIPESGKQEVCQPDVLGHRQSVMVKDVDSDGRLDLISVTSLYVSSRSSPVDQLDANWRLETLVKKIHLEEKIEPVFAKK